MGIFRIAIGVVAIVVIGSLVFNLLGAAGGAVAGAFGLALLIPLFFFKIALLLMFFGFIGRAFWGGGRPDRWGGYRPTRTRERDRPSEDRSEEDRFEKWHDLAHAKEEVDGWVPDLSADDNDIHENGPGR